MNKSVLMSIQPYWVFLIIARYMGWNIPQHKTVEVRKDCPKDSAWNRRVHIYCSKNKKSFNRIPKEYQPFMAKFLGKVIGEFVCDRIYTRPANTLYLPNAQNDYLAMLELACLTEPEARAYMGGQYNKEMYFWHISNLVIYDTLKALGEFKKTCKHNYECADCKYWGFQHVKNGSVDLTCPLDEPLTYAPQSWCYVEELRG